MISWWNKEQRVTVCNAAGFLCVNELRDVAIEKLLAAGFEPAEATAILDTRVHKSVWHSTFAAASSATSVRMEEALEGVATAADVAAVAETTATLQSAVAELQGERASDRRQSEMRELEQHLDAEAQRYRDALTARRQKLTRFAEEFIWRTLWETPAGQRLQELRE
jgi:hypothetical protein